MATISIGASQYIDHWLITVQWLAILLEPLCQIIDKSSGIH